MPVLYEDYDPDSFDDIAEPLAPVRATGPQVYGGLSPFDLPNEVELVDITPDLCVLAFHYVDNEPAERRPRPVPGSDLFVRLGKESKKILEVAIPTRLILMPHAPIDFDDRTVLTWCKNEPERVINSCRRNAWVVSRILHTLTDRFRDELLTAVANYARKKGIRDLLPEQRSDMLSAHG